MPAVARKGDPSDHGGYIISVTTTKTKVNDILVARVGDSHSCPIPGHGITIINTGSSHYICEGAVVAVVGSVCGCGARISAGSGDTFAPLG